MRDNGQEKLRRKIGQVSPAKLSEIETVVAFVLQPVSDYARRRSAILARAKARYMGPMAFHNTHAHLAWVNVASMSTASRLSLAAIPSLCIAGL